MRETSLEALTQPHPLEMAARLLQRLSLQEFVQVCSCIVFHVLVAPTERLSGSEQTQADNWDDLQSNHTSFAKDMVARRNYLHEPMSVANSYFHMFSRGYRLGNFSLIRNH